MTMWSPLPAKCCAPPLSRQFGEGQHVVSACAIAPKTLTLCLQRSTKRHGHSRAAGFTLLEVLVAVVIVAVALVTFMGLHLRSLDATIRAQDLTTAVLLAQGRLATMPEFPETGEEQGKFDGPELERFQWATAVTEQTLDAPDGGQVVTVRHLVVTVLWSDGQQTRQYVLDTYRVQ